VGCAKENRPALSPTATGFPQGPLSARRPPEPAHHTGTRFHHPAKQSLLHCTGPRRRTFASGFTTKRQRSALYPNGNSSCPSSASAPTPSCQRRPPTPTPTGHPLPAPLETARALPRAGTTSWRELPASVKRTANPLRSAGSSIHEQARLNPVPVQARSGTENPHSLWRRLSALPRPRDAAPPRDT
jgi:hypothetical protein